MQRIGILSDTHSCWDDRFAIHFQGCDQIWHAGDIGDRSVLERLRGVCPVVRAVRGNIDSGIVARMCPETDRFTVEGVKVWLTHIGGYPGRYAPGVRRILIEERPRLMVCGHSHILKVMYDKELDLLHVNPGAAGYHGWQRERTLIRLVIDGGDMRDLEVIELGKVRMEV
ncbi:MAG: metallophosphatase family protein [Muribaculaceae bacterium]|nr:metallophosphatase family protein [Muribaculaceae bacterium]